MINELVISRTRNLLDCKIEKKNFILIGHWLLEDFKKEEIEKFAFKIPTPASLEKEERRISYLECEKIFNNLFSDFCENLNKFHCTKLTPRAWRIIAESWLKRFIYICYNRKKTLDIAKEQFDINNVHLEYNKNYLFFTKDCEGQYPASVDDNWNSNLYLKILNYFNYEVNIISELTKQKSIELKTYYERISSQTKSLKFKIFKNFFKFFKIFIKKTDSVFLNTYLPFISEKFLELNFKQMPQLWLESRINYKNYNESKRRTIQFLNKRKEISLENFIREMLPSSLPISFVESFKDIYEQRGHYKFPEKPKFIFISTGFDHDELLKFYIARQVDNGKLFFVGQHGATYFTEFDADFRSEINTPDKFFSWGYFEKNKKKIIPAFNFKTFNKKLNADKNGKLLIVCRSLGYRATPWDRYYEGLLGIEKVSKIMSKMPSFIKEKTIIRLHKSFQLDRSGYFLQKFFGHCSENLEFGNLNYKKLVTKSRLVCFNYDSTGFLENLIYNIPSIAIWDNTFNHINEKFTQKYRMLFNANIIFDDESKLINHLEKNWNNIQDWWNSYNVQDAIKKFNNNFNRQGKKEDFKKLIESLKNEQ